MDLEEGVRVCGHGAADKLLRRCLTVQCMRVMYSASERERGGEGEEEGEGGRGWRQGGKVMVILGRGERAGGLSACERRE